MAKATTAPGVTPRNKNGKTNGGIKYRYPKAIKSKSLKSSAVDLSVLNKNEMKLLLILKKDGYACIPDLQDAIFTERNYEDYGTSDTRNLLRRIGTNPTGSKLIERVPGERGYYRLTTKGEEKLAAFKKAKPAKAAKHPPKKTAPKKKKPAKKKPAPKKTKKTAVKKAA